MPQPSTPKEDFLALILAQRSTEIKDLVIQRKVLARAMRKLLHSPQATESAAVELRIFIWSDIMELCLANQLTDLCHAMRRLIYCLILLHNWKL
ncbi:hypothetical protein BVRB_018460 [Beta vulgaris subsp. vulgaris]|uniref:Uncharacterized protein n=1 Tax=Beta vulgaris subsp. vulgaris TaxID=3555 RepID=A0A0J8BFM0_BETVV|nr:hypothetical protein BVRB_018460 [Beta vulgaris subsp. vulgaris]